MQRCRSNTIKWQHCKHTHICTQTPTHTCTYIYMHMWIHAISYFHTHTHSYTHAHTYTNTGHGTNNNFIWRIRSYTEMVRSLRYNQWAHLHLQRQRGTQAVQCLLTLFCRKRAWKKCVVSYVLLFSVGACTTGLVVPRHYICLCTFTGHHHSAPASSHSAWVA